MFDPVKPIYWADDKLYLLDQTLLPGEFVYIYPQTAEAVYTAIKELKVRGAPAIGIAGAFGLYLGVRDAMNFSYDDFIELLGETGNYLKSSRPTAVNLAWAIDRVINRIKSFKNEDSSILIPEILKEAQQIRDEDEKMCLKIGEFGAGILSGIKSVLTHCNAGTIATAKYGTALSPIYFLAAHGAHIEVYADETRPLLQGARLTAWELKQAGIKVTLITDGMSASVISQKKVEAVIVGADRIAANGDVANKIGTYGLAIIAKEHDIPFYVAAPISSFDLDISDGSMIPIEERSEDEVFGFSGIRVAPEGISAYNPAFDITPNKYISAIITEKGILKPPYNQNIKKMYNN